jgi:hypothetical protein
MSVTAGALSLLSVQSTTDQLSSAAATAGTAPYTYQWYRSTTTGFTPGEGNIITGATSLSLSDSGLIPSTNYFYKVIATDSTAATSTSSQLSVNTTQPQPGQNQFKQSAILGMRDLPFNTNTVSAQVDLSQSGAILAGMAVKIVDSAGGVPKVIACTANTDEVWGFVNFDIKSQAFFAGDRLEVSRKGNVMFLYATGPVARGAQVTLDISSPGAVGQLVASSGANIVGEAFDKAPTAGTLIRVQLNTTSYAFA